MNTPATTTDRNKDNRTGAGTQPAQAGAQTAAGSNAAARQAMEQQVARQANVIDEAGSDSDEEGVGEEQVEVVEDTGEGANQGLFGGAAASVAAGGNVAAAGGLAALGLASGNEAMPSDESAVPVQPPVNLVKGDSEGLNVGPSPDGSVLVSGGQTNVGVLGSETPLATANNLSVLNPQAALPSGNPVAIDPENQVVGVDLGPVAQTELDLNVDPLPDTVVNFALEGLTGDISVEELVALDIPTSLAGNDVPLTSTLNDVLSQVSDALIPIPNPLPTLLDNADVLGPLQAAAGDAPLIGDVLAQVEGVATDGLPTGGLPIPIPADSITIPQTGTPVDVVTSLIPSSISSVANGDLPLSGALEGISPT